MTNLLQAFVFIGKMVNTKYLCNLLNNKISYPRQNLKVLIDIKPCTKGPAICNRNMYLLVSFLFQKYLVKCP